MGDVINLRLVRKAKTRSEAEIQAGQNRVIFGQTKTEKTVRKLEDARAKKALEAGKIAPLPPDSDPK
jgi:hypothetical protein